jgi:hypothetical protein
MQEWAPQAMLFGLAIDLALVGMVQMRLWKDNYRAQLLALIVLLGMGAVAGLIWSDLSSAKAEVLLVAYEALLPAIIFLQFARFLPRLELQWAFMPISAVMMIVAFNQGWGFQSSQMLYYETVILIVQVALVLGWSIKGAFTEEELIFILAALALLLVFGPGYGLLWSNFEINKALFAIIGSAAGVFIVVGRLRSSFLHFIFPRDEGRRKTPKIKRGELPEGILIVSKQGYNSAWKTFELDIKAGRNGIWISMDPASHLLKKKGTLRTKVPGLLTAQLTHSLFVENAMDPMKLETIKRSFLEFLKMNGDGIIFVKDLHYLVSNTDIWETIELLKFLRERIPSKSYTILLGSDLIGDWELEYLKKAGAKDWTRDLNSPVRQ